MSVCIIKKLKRSASALLPLLLLTGCGLITSADSLMSPPRLNAEQNEIYNALVKDIGSSVNLIYPRSGKLRSAYIIRDLDGDGTDEALVFYKRNNSSETDNPVRINIFHRNNDGKWNSVYDHAGTGVFVDSADISPIGKDSRIFLIVGYGNMSSSGKSIQVYSYSNGILNTEYTDVYSEYLLTDLISEGKNDLVLFGGSGEKDGSGNSVTLVSDSENGLEELGSAPLSSDAVSFEAVTRGHISEKTSAVFIDEADNEGMIFTEIIYCVDGSLRNPAAVEGSTICAATRRPRGYICRDADGDGITEIPVTEPMPGYKNETEQLLITKWNVFENYEIREKNSGWYSRAGNWCLMFPGRWKDLVTVRIDSVSGAAVFCRYETSAASSPELMRIAAVNKSDSDKYFSSGFSLITTSEDIDYLVKYSDSADSLILTATELKNNFFILR